jgi:CheY-like chemotaxis protein
VRLDVHDAGHGMSGETLERIFDPFFSTKPPGEGTGLGLAVVHGIMQAHEGAITVESAPGRGTTFRLYFPMLEGATPAEASTEPAPVPGRGEHLMVVDDEPALVNVASRLLRQLDYRVTGHTDPEQALTDFERHPAEFDLVLCDLTMPGMSGLQLSRRMLAVRPELPILLVSGYAGSMDPAEWRQAGIRELITKPYETRQLAKALRTQLAAED